ERHVPAPARPARGDRRGQRRGRERRGGPGAVTLQDDVAGQERRHEHQREEHEGCGEAHGTFSGRFCSVTSTCSVVPLRSTVSLILSPGALVLIVDDRSVASLIAWPSIWVTTSPACRPPCSAGPFVVTDAICAPAVDVVVGAGAISTPSHACWTVRPSLRPGSTWRTVLDGTAKPMPTLPEDMPLVAICELTPMTLPPSSSSGPPELPGLIAASVWMTSSIWKPLGACSVRPRLETMPSVTVRSSPKGLPMAIATSPTVTPVESANCRGLVP